MIREHSRELSVAGAIAGLSLVLAVIAPGYFSRENLTGMFLANVPVLIIAAGMTLVILTGQIDISVGSIFAVCGVAAGVLAKAGLPVAVAGLAACFIGATLGSLNGALVAYLRIPSIVVTLAAMAALRDGLRWATQGAWIENLPAGFQWLGFSQAFWPAVMLLIGGGISIAVGWALRNSVRFNQIPANAGLGLEMKVIAAVVVGGASITGGSGTIAGTVLGVIL